MGHQTLIQPGKKFWEQPGLEKIIEGVRSVSPLLQEADNHLLFRLLLTAKRKDGFNGVLDQLGAREHRNRVWGYISEIYDQNPQLEQYFKDFSPYTTPIANPEGVPTFESYSASAQSSEDRMNFGIRNQDKPPSYGGSTWYLEPKR